MKQASISVRIHLLPHSKIASMEVRLNGQRMLLKKENRQSTWQCAKVIAGPLDFTLRATGNGTLFLHLNCGRQAIIKKPIAFTEEFIQMKLNDIPLLG